MAKYISEFEDRGFTIIELILVLIILGILSAVTIPTFFSSTSFNNSNARNTLQSALNFTRNRATTTQCTLEFRLTKTGWSVWRDDDCQSTGNSGAGCATPLNFITAVPAPGETNQLSGSLTSSALERLFFTPTGQLYRSNSAGDCTSLPANPVPGGTQVTGLTPATMLRLDGVTGYAALQ